eukprot:5138907-Amphidinium_carterae.1
MNPPRCRRPSGAPSTVRPLRGRSLPQRQPQGPTPGTPSTERALGRRDLPGTLAAGMAPRAGGDRVEALGRAEAPPTRAPTRPKAPIPKLKLRDRSVRTGKGRQASVATPRDP